MSTTSNLGHKPLYDGMQACYAVVQNTPPAITHRQQCLESCRMWLRPRCCCTKPLRLASVHVQTTTSHCLLSNRRPVRTCQKTSCGLLLFHAFAASRAHIPSASAEREALRMSTVTCDRGSSKLLRMPMDSSCEIQHVPTEWLC